MDKGISSPFVRGAQGYFKVDVGADLIKSNIAQILASDVEIISEDIPGWNLVANFVIFFLSQWILPHII